MVQQVELVEHPFIVTEHRAREYRDPATGQIFVTPFPPEVRAAGLLGTRLTAFVAYLKGGCPFECVAPDEFPIALLFLRDLRCPHGTDIVDR